jgi:hypothetical protein
MSQVAAELLSDFVAKAKPKTITLWVTLSIKVPVLCSKMWFKELVKIICADSRPLVKDRNEEF